MAKALVLSAVGIFAVVGLVILARPDGQATIESAVDGEGSDNTESLGPGDGSVATTDSVIEQAASSSGGESTTLPTGGPTSDTSPEEVGHEPIPSTIDDRHFLWLWADPADIRLIWRDGGDRPYNQLQAGRAALESQGETVVLIGNAGIYEPGLIPAGLHIEQGRELVSLNERSGTGNFYLQPNGVFWIGEGAATINDTATFAQRYSPNHTPSGRAQTVDEEPIDLALQSGPMLVIDGEANPRFKPDVTSKHIRNAVAVDAQGRVLLIISRQPINLRSMADKCIELGAVDALYLDGSISRLEQPVDGRPIFPNIPVAAMLAAVEPS